MEAKVKLGQGWKSAGWITAVLMLFALFPCPSVFAQELTIDANRQFTFAQHLYQNGQYRRAAEEYQRFSYFFPDDSRARQARYLAADAYFNSKDYVTALGILNDLNRQMPLDTVAVKAYFLSAECYLQMGAPSQALVQLHNLISLSDEPDVRDRALFRMGWIHIDQMDWPAARRAFGRIRPGSDLPAQQLSTALARTDAIPQKSPALAGSLSIVPGAGQLYCGRYQDALAAFVVNVGLIWAAVDAFNQEQYALGGLLSFVGAGFYTGNIYSAVSDAHKYNRLQKQQFIEQLKQHVSLGVQPVAQNKRATGVCLMLKITF